MVRFCSATPGRSPPPRRYIITPPFTQRYELSLVEDEKALTEEIVDLAKRFGRYGYRRVTALLRHRGWDVNHKRVERIW